MIDQTVIVLLLQLQIAIRKIENFVFFQVKKRQFASVAWGELLLCCKYKCQTTRLNHKILWRS